MDTKEGNGAGFSPRDMWTYLLIAALGGLGGGIGWRQVDPSAYTAADARLLAERVRLVELELRNKPPPELLITVDRLVQTTARLEREVNKLNQKLHVHPMGSGAENH